MGMNLQLVINTVSLMLGAPAIHDVFQRFGRGNENAFLNLLHKAIGD